MARLRSKKERGEREVFVPYHSTRLFTLFLFFSFIFLCSFFSQRALFLHLFHSISFFSITRFSSKLHNSLSPCAPSARIANNTTTEKSQKKRNQRHFFCCNSFQFKIPFISSNFPFHHFNPIQSNSMQPSLFLDVKNPIPACLILV